MKLRFVHKNLGHIYNIVEGANLSMSYNEDLSSGTIILRETSKIDIEPYDEVVIIELGFYMLIDTYNLKETRNRVGSKVYTYVITLMSQTKLLENKILPNLTITPHYKTSSETSSETTHTMTITSDLKPNNFELSLTPQVTFNRFKVSFIDSNNVDLTDKFLVSDKTVYDPDISQYVRYLTFNVIDTIKKPEGTYSITYTITYYTNGNLSIFTYLCRYNNLYGEKVRTSTGFANRYEFSVDVANKFSEACPELQFTTPTLRECFTKLMMVKNCIPILHNNVISYLDLSKTSGTNHTWNNDKFSYKESSQSASDYVSELKMNLQNVIQDDNYMTNTEYIGFRNNDTVKMTDSNLELYTQFPIYEIESLILVSLTSGLDVAKNSYYAQVYQDLTNYNGHPLIYEKSYWETLEYVSSWPSASEWYKYQNTTLYYTRGSNKIEGFSTSSRIGIFTFENNVFYKYVSRFAGDLTSTVVTFEPSQNHSMLCTGFIIKYKTKSSLTFKQGKSALQSNEREVVDNQEGNYVNAFTQGLLEYSKANRLGNVLNVYHMRYLPTDTLPVISDTIEGNDIIYKIDYQYWDNCTDVTAYTCPNYVMQNYFTSVRSRLRSWKIADGSEAYERNELYKTYIEVSRVGHKDTYKDFQNLENIYSIFMGILYGEKKTLTDIFFKYNNSLNDGLMLEVNQNIAGYNIVFSCGFDDNYYAGRNIKSSEDTLMWEKVLTYTENDYGELENVKLKYLINYTPTGMITESKLIDHDYFYSLFNSAKAKVGALPYVIADSTITASKIVFDKYLAKDNKEIMKFHMQFEYCVDDIYQDYIALGSEFMSLLKGENYIKESSAIRFAASDTPFNKSNPELPETYSVITRGITYSVSYDSTYDSIKLEFTNIPAGYYLYMYLINRVNNKVILAWRMLTFNPTFYFNFLQKRNKNIYAKNDNDEWEKTGTI